MALKNKDKDMLDPDFECLADEKKIVLLRDPSSSQIELCFKALPHYDSFVKQRDVKVKQRNIKFHTKFPPENQPIPIKNEHEFAHLYLEEAYSHLSGCRILELNMDAILTILSKASCFPENLRKQASAVKDLRNHWLCSTLDHWTKNNTTEAMAQLTQLAQMVPGAQQALKMGKVKFPGIAFHLNVQTYRSLIKDGQHEKVEFKIRKLQSDSGREIYVERCYKEAKTGKITSSVNDLLLPNRVVLLKGEAGSGKSSVTTKLIKRWTEEEAGGKISVSYTHLTLPTIYSV